jgi:hypothetical protein
VNLHLYVWFNTNGAPHGTGIDHGTFSQVAQDGLNGTNGRWVGSRWVGKFLSNESSQSPQALLAAINEALAKSGDSWSDAGDGPILPEITIVKEEVGTSRTFGSLRISRSMDKRTTPTE